LINSAGTLTPPELDLTGYLECLQRCRDRFPDLRIISGVELGEPHWHSDVVARLLGAGQFDRVLGSLHSLPIGQHLFEMPELYRRRPAEEVVSEYLTEIPRLIASSDSFAVLAHIEYAVAYWPERAGPFDPKSFEDDFRHALRVLADSGRALEVNTKMPLHPEVVGWWREEGKRSRLEAMLTIRLCWRRASPKRRPWWRPMAFVPAVIAMTTGGVSARPDVTPPLTSGGSIHYATGSVI
jgi:histidinol-phosphatase (PHP family)